MPSVSWRDLVGATKHRICTPVVCMKGSYECLGFLDLAAMWFNVLIMFNAGPGMPGCDSRDLSIPSVKFALISMAFLGILVFFASVVANPDGAKLHCISSSIKLKYCSMPFSPSEPLSAPILLLVLSLSRSECSDDSISLESSPPATAGKFTPLYEDDLLMNVLKLLNSLCISSISSVQLEEVSYVRVSHAL